MPDAPSTPAGRCTRCGASLADVTPDALCVRCLLANAVAPISHTEAEAAALLAPEKLLQRRVFAGYELIEEIARGGMGVVFRARQSKLGRQVALKVIAAGELASPRMVERFRTEAEAAARLQHPHIVPILEVGHHDGWHFFSMRLIEGGTLAAWMREWPVSPEAAARLLAKVARAVHHAHQHGVLHRDLKPTNILLDPQGEPHLTDFGLAKILEDSRDLTYSAAVLGTPAYMAPEQAIGQTRDVTVAADVYGLGAVLYELLAGRPPFVAPNTPALLLKITEEDVPSFRHESAAAHDLEVICLKCLEKEPSRRYASAAELADDLERWLRDEPVQARASTRWERSVKWTRRHPAKAALALLVPLSLAIITVGSLWFNFRLSEARDAAETLATRAQELARTSNRQLVNQHLIETARSTAAGDSFLGALPAAEAFRLAGNDVDRLSAGLRLNAIVDRSPRLLRLWDARAAVKELVFSKHQRQLIARLSNGVQVWNTESGELLNFPGELTPDSRILLSAQGNSVLVIHPQSARAGWWDLTANTLRDLPREMNALDVVALSPDGLRVATGGAMARVWDAQQNRVLSLTNSRPITMLAFAPDGGELLAVDDRREGRFWSAIDGRLRAGAVIKYSGTPRSARFSADGRLVATAQDQATHIQVHYRATGGYKFPVSHRALLFDYGFSPKGEYFAVAGWGDLQARIFSTQKNNDYRQRIVHESGANHATFSPDGRFLLTAGFDYKLQLRDALSHERIGPVIEHNSLIESVALSSDSRLLATGDVDGGVRVWDLQPLLPAAIAPGNLDSKFAFSLDGRLLTTVQGSNQIHVVDVVGKKLATTIEARPPVTRTALDASGRWVGQSALGNGAQVWSLRDARLTLDLKEVGTVSTLAFDPTGDRVVVASRMTEARVWNLNTLQEEGPPMPHATTGTLVEWSLDGRWIAIAGGSDRLTVWDARTHKPVGELVERGAEVSAARFTRNGERLLVAFANDTIEPAFARLHRLPSLEPVSPPLRHGDGVAEAIFSPDETRVATGGEDNVARIWRVADGQPIGEPMRHASALRGLAFDPSGSMLATVTLNQRLRFWDARRGHLLAPALPLPTLAPALRFAPQGNGLVIATSRQIRWMPALRRNWSATDWQRMASSLSGRQLDESGGTVPLRPAQLSAQFEQLRRAHPEEFLWPAPSPE